MTLTLLLAVTLAPGRRAWPGAALPHPSRPAPSGLGPRRPPQGTCASCLAALGGEVAEAQAHWGGVGGGEGVESQNYSAQLHSLPRNRVLYFSSSCLVLRCGKGEKHKGKSVIAFLGGRQNSAERRLVAKLSRDGK